MAMTWDMHTSGLDVGKLVQPLRYTTTEADATRVRVFLDLSTKLGSWTLNVNRGLDYERMLSPTASDAERAAYVRDLVLDDPGVEDVIGEPAVTVDGGTLDVYAQFMTADGVIVTIGEVP